MRGARGDDQSLAAFDSSALTIGTSQNKSATISYDGLSKIWSLHPINDGDGTGLGGRRSVKSYLLNQPNRRFALFACTAQGVFMGTPEGASIPWNRVAEAPWPLLQGDKYEFNPPSAVHTDIWDVHMSPAGNAPIWLAGDGGVFTTQLGVVDKAPKGTSPPWTPQNTGMHIHQAHTLTVVPSSPIARSRLAYPTSDDDAWYQDASPLAMPAAAWEVASCCGDANWTVADASSPNFALLVRHRQNAMLVRFASSPPQGQGIVLASYWMDMSKRVIPSIAPEGPTMFQFIQDPKPLPLTSTLDAVMMVELPLTFWDEASGKNIPFDPNSPLGKSSNGMPVLIRNTNFDANPDINQVNGKGKGWKIEIPSLPPGTRGFSVSGKRAAPVYYAFAMDGGGTLSLHRRDGINWMRLAITDLLSSDTFGPAFVNPYDPTVLFALTKTAVMMSTDSGKTFTPDARLTAFVAGEGNFPMSTLVHMAFNYDNPGEIVAASKVTGLFYRNAAGVWANLTPYLPLPHSPITDVGVDCEAVSAATNGRSILKVVGYRNVSPDQAISLTVQVSDVEDHLEGTPQQTSLVHTFPRVTIGDDNYVDPFDPANLTFKKTVVTQDTVPVHIEIWRRLDRVLGVVKQENGKWVVDYGKFGKQALSPEFDQLTDEEKRSLHPAPPGPPGVVPGKVRSLKLSYSHLRALISGDVFGIAGAKIQVPNGTPNSVGFDFAITQK